MKTHFPSLLLLAISGLAVAQELPERVTSLSHPYGHAGISGDAVVMGDLLYYGRRTVTLGTELWRTDGTAEGTRLVTETITGVRSESPNTGWMVVGNQLYFGTGSAKIWKTDGTAAGTTAVTVRSPEVIQSEGMRMLSPAPGGGVLLMTDHLYDPNWEIRMRVWKTDGTEAGTIPLAADFTMGTVQVAGSTIWMDGAKLRKSDGTPEGTVVAFTHPPEQWDAVGLVWAMGDDTALFTTVHDGKWMLQRLDPSGVTPLKETGFAIPSSSGPAVLGGAVYFLTRDQQGTQLVWRSDGTEDGTTLVQSIPTPQSGSSVRSITVGGKVYFHVSGSPGSGWSGELWVSDGTAAGTVRLMPTAFTSPTVHGDGLYFIHLPVAGSQQLWTTDGTVEGTVMVADLGPTSVNPTVRMGATASGLILAGGSTVWRSDGTAAGTVAAPVGRVLGGQPINGLTPMTDGQVLFAAPASGTERRLWKSDGTAAGTAMVQSGQPGTTVIRRMALGTAVMMDGVRYFTADDGVHGSELWRSDGTAEGTWMVKDALPGMASSQPQSLTVFKGEVWFAASDANGDQRVWRTDGTDAGTRMEMNAGGGRAHREITLSTEWQGNLIVRFSGTSSPAGIWWTDGTPEGTGRLTEDDVPTRFILKHDALTYYWVGDELWRMDGTPGGKAMVKRFRYGARIFGFGGVLLALAGGQGGPDAAEYAGLWRIPPDGAPVRLRTFGNHASGVVSGGMLLFGVTHPAADAGLWTTDGTAEGTRRLQALVSTGEITEHRERIYFSGNDGIHGEEPWVSDGTVEGTRMLVDLTGDSGGSSPALFTPSGGKLYFTATTEEEGSQLYVLDTGGVPTTYNAWLDAHRPRMDGRTEPGDDADEDGFTNLQEFAFGGNPADAAVRPFLSSGLAVVSPAGGGDPHLSLTVPVRRGTVFMHGRPATGMTHGVTYRILATKDLTNPATLLEVREDTTAPHPPHPDEDYEYRTFRLEEPVSARERAFLRVVTE